MCTVAHLTDAASLYWVTVHRMAHFRIVWGSPVAPHILILSSKMIMLHCSGDYLSSLTRWSPLVEYEYHKDQVPIEHKD